jgi:hypothetical protein
VRTSQGRGGQGRGRKGREAHGIKTERKRGDFISLLWTIILTIRATPAVSFPPAPPTSAMPTGWLLWVLLDDWWRKVILPSSLSRLGAIEVVGGERGVLQVLLHVDWVSLRFLPFISFKKIIL